MRPIPRHVLAGGLPPVSEEQCKGGVWFLPSRNRADRARDCMEACVKAGQTTQGVLIQDGCDYITLQPPWTSPWQKIKLDAQHELAGALQKGWKRYPRKLWYGIISDGVRPITPGWDRLLLAASQGKNFVSCSDNGWREDTRMAGILLVPGWIIEAMRYWFPEGMIHLYTDDVWEQIAGALGNWVYAEDVVVTDNHHSHPDPANRTTFDHPRIFKGKPYADSDRDLFNDWRYGPEFAETIDRIKRVWWTLTGEVWE